MIASIENFQSIADARLTVEGFTAVTGPSNRGKSASLRAVSGALFNKPGDDFVRLGASRAEVTLTGLPTCQPKDAGGTVTWTKGRGANSFVINSVHYDKVGVGAPDALAVMGYHDLWIGDKERDKGEAIRPQVAGQFDGLFLLGRPGSFIADTIAHISRVTTLRTAHGRAVSDLRALKQLRGVRARDLDAAQQALERLTPVRALDTRTEGLGLLMEAFRGAESRLQTLQTTIARRVALAPVAALTLPAPVYEVIHALARVEDVGILRGLVDRRLVVLDVLAWLREDVWLKPAPAADAERVLAEADRYTQARVLADRRTQLALAVATPMPKAFRSEGLDKAAERIGTMRTAVAQREAQKRDLFERQRALKAVTGELEDAEAALAALLATFKECPVCGGPMS